MEQRKRIVRIFGWASFLNDLGSDMIFPVWPLFVKSLGASMTALGFLDGMGQALLSLSQALSGYFSDRIGKRKLFIWIGYLMSSFSRIGYAFSHKWWHLIPFKALDRGGKIRSAPRDAIVAEVSKDEDRGKNFGFLRMMDNLGAFTGIIICILIFPFLGYHKLFLLAAIPSLFAVVLVLLFVKDFKKRNSKFAPFSYKVLNSNLKFFFLISGLFSLSSFSYSFLLIFAKGQGFKTGFIPLLYLIFTAVASLFSLPIGRLSDRLGRKFVLIFSYLLWTTVTVVFIWSQTKLAIIIAFFIYGLHRGAIEPVQRAFVSEIAPDNYKATALGLFQMLVGVISLFASFLAGILWDKINPLAPFYLSVGLSIMSSILLMRTKF